MKKANKFLGITFIILAALCTIFAIVSAGQCGWYYSTVSVSYITYGGDAYTDIQNAAADTANNIRSVVRAIENSQYAFALISCMFFVALSLLFLFLGISRLILAGAVETASSAKPCEPSSTPKHCPSCGTTVDNGRFCSRCGKDLAPLYAQAPFVYTDIPGYTIPNSNPSAQSPVQ